MVVSRGRIGRNDPCWCGSGAKFKRCHLNRAQQEPLSHEAIFAQLKTATRPVGCLHPQASPLECSGKAIQSHTVPEAALREIAEDGHLIALHGDYGDFLKTDGDLRARPIGIHEASAFRGFCARHDSATFASIETHPYVPCPEHAFLWSYRALCRELYLWTAKKRLSLRDLDRGLSPIGQELVQKLAAEEAVAADLGLVSLSEFKAQYDHALLSREFSQMNYYAISFDRAPDVMVTSMFAPFADFAGRVIRTAPVLGTTNDHCTVSLFSSAATGWFQIAWLGPSAAGEAFATSLSCLPVDQIPHALVRLAFSHFSNSYFRPSWWNSLGQEAQLRLQRRMWNPANPFAPRADNYLIDDDQRLVGWRVTGRYSSSRSPGLCDDA